ncbi:hypothetical protein GCM10029992_58050 [Glycomyces albus]
MLRRRRLDTAHRRPGGGPWLTDRGLTAGTITGALLYVLYGLQPALNSLISGVGGSGLRFVVTLGRILDATEAPEPPRAAGTGPPGRSTWRHAA